MKLDEGSYWFECGKYGGYNDGKKIIKMIFVGSNLVGC